MNIQRDIFPLRGAESTSSPGFSLPVLDQTSSQFTSTTFNAGTDFTVPTGSAGGTVTIQLKYGQILGQNGRVGYFGNSSLVLGGALATTLTTEVAFIANSTNTGGNVTSLSNGQYMVDYETGIIYGKRADNGTTGTATYSYWLKSSVSSGGSGNTTQIASTNIVSGTTSPSAITAGEQNVLADAVYNTAAPAPTNGQRVNLQSDSSGNLKVTIAGQSAGSALADATANPTTTLAGALLEGFNGTTWDRIRAGISTATSTLTGFLNALPLAIYNSSAPTLTNGQVGLLQANTSGSLNIDETLAAKAEDNTNSVFAVSEKFLGNNSYANATAQNNSFTTFNAKSTSGTLIYISCINTTASVRYLQDTNTATTPAGGATVTQKWLIPANGMLVLGPKDLAGSGIYQATGHAFSNSSTASTYTAGTAGDLLLEYVVL